jgi:uncharacterized protein
LFNTAYNQQQVNVNLSEALFLKGLSYSTLGLVLKDINKAIPFFHQSAGLGNVKAMLSLGKLYSEEKGYLNKDSALSWFNQAAELGNSEAWLRIGNLYRFALAGIAQDFDKAYSFYEKGAAKGDADCLSMLGYFHYKGLAGKQNYSLAYTYLTMAADKGNATAKYFKGLIYRNGYGVERNLDKAKELLTSAVSRGEKQAIKELKNLNPENPIVPILPPVKIQQFDNSTYHRIKHNLPAGSVKGNYRGFAIRYDWSGQNIISIFPLEVLFDEVGSIVTGTWKEGNDITDIDAVFTDSSLVFANTQYKKIDHYSEFIGGEVWQFNNARFNLLQLSDSIFITGNIQLYSNIRKETGKPLYIHLSRAKTKDEFIVMDKTKSSITCNNPFDNSLSITFTIPSTTPVVIQLLNIHGQPIMTEHAGTLHSGTYRKVLQISSKLASGNYILQLISNAGKESKIIIKQ